MHLAIWNIRGFHKSSKHKIVKEFIQEYHLSFLALLETKLSESKLQFISRKITTNWQWNSNVQEAKNCRIWILWDNDIINVHIIKSSEQFLTCSIESKDGKISCFCTIVYALNQQINRRSLWNDLLEFKHNVNCPWLIGGDFNSIISSEEKIGGLPVTEAETFTSNQVDYLMPGCFDHSPALLTIGDDIIEGKKPFKFYNMWVKHPDFLKTVSSIWDQDIHGYMMFKLHTKLKKLKPALKELNKKYFMDISEQVLRSKKELADIQRAKINWGIHGDKSSHFFHSVMKNKRHHNRIMTLYDRAGNRLTEMSDIVSEFLDFYKNLLGTSTSTLLPDPEVISNGPLLSPDHRNMLSSPVTREEIKQAVFSIPNEKSPGPDGFSAYLFKASWSIIEEELYEAIEEFFNSGKLLGTFNSTAITLIPKVLNPQNATDFRPIACYDILLFGKADMSSITRLNECLMEFSQVSGLEPNPAKCSVFLSGIDEVLKAQICSYLKFSEGVLPLRYLGVPLITKRLSWLDCSPLISRISSQFQNWQNNKTLSYAGRLQLIKSVILGIQMFWTSNYILPIKVLEKIDKMCVDFLWGHKMHLVAWSAICQDHKQGGLGVYSAKFWNFASAAKLLWMIHNKKDIMWIKWIHGNYLRQNNVWQVQNRKSDSWMWKQILKVRDLLSLKFGSIDNMLSVINNCCTGDNFSISAMYKRLNQQVPSTISGTIWGGWHYPKHSFILWLASISRLLT
ncbi:uncharacterized protein LOC109838865 [Asparagus officinalis]|uniref:uncharacterized protein LOC109838865 n=1 Tax=Asparagus officinalis TaxID=4686 RepID=UPI00098E827A|nr:uncharacterized protein LOC109838865 [Asparagus officinalis]